MAANNQVLSIDATALSKELSAPDQEASDNPPSIHDHNQRHESAQSQPVDPLLSSSPREPRDSLEAFLRSGPAPEGLSADTPLPSALQVKLPESDASSASSKEPIEPKTHHDVKKTYPAEMYEAGSDLQSPTQSPEIYQRADSHPPLPPSRTSSLHTVDSSSRNTQHCSNQVDSSTRNSLEDLNRIGYGRMCYIERVREMATFLPHLECILSQPRHNRAGTITWYDYKGTRCLGGPRITISNLYDGHTKEQIVRLRARLREDTSLDIDMRVLVVSDLSTAVIDFLGSAFDISPECFAEHLHNSGYINGTFNDQDPRTWKTAGMNKDYISVSWLRPITKNEETPSSSRLKELLDPEHNDLQWSEKRAVVQGGKVYPIILNHQETPLANIFRSEFPLEMASNDDGTEPSAWRERATIWLGVSGTCQISKFMPCYFLLYLTLTMSVKVPRPQYGVMSRELIWLSSCLDRPDPRSS